MAEMYLGQLLKGLGHEIKDWSLFCIHRIDLDINNGRAADIFFIFFICPPSKKCIFIFFAVNANLSPSDLVPLSHYFNFLRHGASCLM